MDDELEERSITWGSRSAIAALRGHVNPTLKGRRCFRIPLWGSSGHFFTGK
jgi:hypothetical protein